MADAQKTLRFRGVNRAVEELAKLSDKADAWAPRDEIEGIVQAALDQIHVSIDGGPFKLTGLRVGTQERIEKLVATPKNIDLAPNDLLLNIEGWLDDNPSDHVAIKAWVEKADKWFSDHPEVSIE